MTEYWCWSVIEEAILKFQEIPSTEPGLGVELDEKVALAHPYSDTELHLEMADKPIQ